MRRREFIGTLAGGAIAVALPAGLLRAEKVYRIGFLAGQPALPIAKGFIQRLEELGYSEGKNINVAWRPNYGQAELVPALAAELVGLKVDVIVAGGSTAALGVQQATTTIPIVVLASHDGIGTGLYESLARPGGNITGIDSMAPALDAKRVEMLKEILPQLLRLTVLYNPSFPGAKIHSETIKAAAERINTTVRFVEVERVSDFETALSTILSDRPDAILTVEDPLIYVQGRKRILDFGAAHGIPTIHEFKIFVEEGGLISYGSDLLDIWRRGADHVDKILKGEKPGDIPVEQPTKFDLAINLKTAKALGITFPNNLIVSANTVIE
jgi:putative ABC transport system substrate-binding protein